MEYITTVQAAKKWGISPTRVTILAKDGRIPGAARIGSRWMIPDDAVKPPDGRTKEAKEAPQADESPFRYPIFEYKDPASFSPPLCGEELQIKRAAEHIYACRFKEADEALGDLPERTENRCRRIFALRMACTISIFLNNVGRFFDCYGKLTTQLQGEFSHKLEMCETQHELDASLGINAREFQLKSACCYHESFLPHLAALSTISLFYSAGKGLTLENLKPHELLCAVYDKSNHYVDRQTIHLYLGCCYTALGINDEATRHFRCALELAEKYELYYTVSSEYYYMEAAFAPALEGFSPKFRERLEYFGNEGHIRYQRFMNSASMSSLFELLRDKEYLYILYAAQGYNNKDVASFLHVSESTVSRRYNEIYDMLGVKTKQDLVQLVNRTIAGNPVPDGE